MISAEIVAIDFLSSRPNASKRKHRRVCTSTIFARYFRDHLSKILAFIITLLCYLARYHFRTIMNENRRRPPYFQHRSSEYVTDNIPAMRTYFFSEQHTRLTLIHDAVRCGAIHEGTRVHEETQSFRPEHQSQVRCNRREKCEGIDDRETNEWTAHLTRCDTAHGSRRTGEPRANANSPDRPFSTDETDRTAASRAGTDTILVPVSPAPSQPSSPYPRPTFRSVHRYLPPDLSQVRIDAVGVSSNMLGTCRTFYLHGLSPVLFLRAISLRADEPIRRIKWCNSLLQISKFSNFIFKFISIKKLFRLVFICFPRKLLVSRDRYITIYWISYILYFKLHREEEQASREKQNF